MLTYNELKEKCTCWKGYKRKPGTKPCADGSCIKEEKDAGGHGSEKHHVMAFGRMNPITSGHEAVVNKVHSVAKEHGASHNVIVSHSQDAKKNPLSGEQKVKHAKNAFPGTTVSSASKESPTILHHAAAAHKAGATHLHVVAGSDRHEEMHNLLHKYNGKDSAHGHYNFKKITVHSSGERDPDSEGTTGISASKMREHAASGNKAEFHKGAPSKMKPEHKDAMYNDVRKGMNIKEETTPYWKKPSFNKRMSQMAKQERLERERKEAEKKPVKEETLDQQDDREKQLKRFKDQVAALLSGKADTLHNPDEPMHPRHAKIKHMTETLRPDMGAAAYINDFIKSTNPRFNNKSKEERRKMAIGAYMGAKAKVKEEVQIDELSTELLGKYKTAAGASAKASDEAGNYKKGDKRFAGINKATRKQFDNDLKKHGQYVKEARGLADKYYSIAQDRKETADQNKGNKEVYHTHMADHHDHMSRYHEELGQHSHAQAHADKADIHHEKSLNIKEGTMQPNGTDQIDTMTSAPTASTVKDTTVGKKIKGFRFFSGETDKPVKEGYNDNRRGFGKRPREDDEYHVPDPEVKKAKVTKEEVEVLDEKSEQAKQNKTMKNMMDASRGARFKLKNPVPDAGPEHKNAQAHNKAIGRALRNEEALDEMKTGNPGYGYHGQHQSTHDADEAYKNTHAHVKSLTDGDDKTVKHYLDSAHGRHLVGREQDHEYVKKDFKKFTKHYRPEMHEAVGVNVDKVNAAGQEPHEEKFVPAKKITKLKKEETMKSYKEFLQSLDEKLVGGQKKLDKNHNNKLDAQDFKMLRKEELEQIQEYEAKDGVYKHSGKSYGASYSDPEGADETAADMKKKEKKAAGRKTGQSTGSYKPRATMSKLKQAGATYK